GCGPRVSRRSAESPYGRDCKCDRCMAQWRGSGGSTPIRSGTRDSRTPGSSRTTDLEADKQTRGRQGARPELPSGSRRRRGRRRGQSRCEPPRRPGRAREALPVKLQFSGSPLIRASREYLWSRLTDPDFVAASAPGVEAVEALDPTHFKVISGLGVGFVKVRFNLDVELFDIVESQSLKMRSRGKAPGSMVDTVSTLRIAEATPGSVRLDWSATTEVSGIVAGIGARLLEGTARKLTQDFWTDFARRVGGI